MAFGLRSLVCELEAIPEKASKPEIISLKASYWRSSAEKMRVFVIHEMLSQQYEPDSPQMRAFMRNIKSVEPPPPLAPIKTLTQAIAHEGLGFDFIQLDNMIVHNADYYPGFTFQTLPDYIQTVDNTCGSLNRILITTAAHTIQGLTEAQPLSKSLLEATVQLGRVEGLFRLINSQPLTFALNHTWLPRDILRAHGIDPAHIATAGKDLLQFSNKEFFDGLKKNEIPNSKIRANIDGEWRDDTGEQQLEQDLHYMRSSDPARSGEELHSVIPSHLQNIKTITMEELRTGLRESNKTMAKICREQIAALRKMQVDVPKALRPYFFQTYVAETYLDLLEELDYDTLDPQLHIWGPKQMFKLQAKMLWGKTISRY